MAEHRIGEIYRKALAAFKSLDRGETRSGLANFNVVEMASWRAPRTGQALVDSMSLMEDAEIDVDILDMTQSEDRVVGLVTAKVRVDDMEFTFRTAEVARLIDGKVSERWTLPNGSITVGEPANQPA